MEQLTPRQREIIKLLKKGYSNKKIGDKLGIAVGTVKQHLHRIFFIMKVKSRFSLITKVNAAMRVK